MPLPDPPVIPYPGIPPPGNPRSAGTGRDPDHEWEVPPVAALCPVLWGPGTTTLLAVHVAHRVWAAAGRCGADEQGRVPAMAVTAVADAMMISSTGSTTAARNLAAGRPGGRIAAMPRDRGRGNRTRQARPAPASTRCSHDWGR